MNSTQIAAVQDKLEDVRASYQCEECDLDTELLDEVIAELKQRYLDALGAEMARELA